MTGGRVRERIRTQRGSLYLATRKEWQNREKWKDSQEACMHAKVEKV